jgi:hypothetical protein
VRPHAGSTARGSSDPSAAISTRPSYSNDCATMRWSARGVALMRTSRSIAIETIQPS